MQVLSGVGFVLICALAVLPLSAIHAMKIEILSNLPEQRWECHSQMVGFT